MTSNLGELLKQKLNQPTLAETMADMYAQGMPTKEEPPKNPDYNVVVYKLQYSDNKLLKDEIKLFSDIYTLCMWVKDNLWDVSVKVGHETKRRYENINVDEHQLIIYGSSPDYCAPEYLAEVYMVRTYYDYDNRVSYILCKGKDELIKLLTSLDDNCPEVSNMSIIGAYKSKDDVNVSFWR